MGNGIAAVTSGSPPLPRGGPNPSGSLRSAWRFRL